ncbi:hypothetical protein DSM106972_094550 [Dulcicalothrix desertica PCC 7102]|uniref:Uncharacterized protein n=1 Tax=Dulcicalothrix desertica PCC 7102 TaxID=232991 RepID=A0A3S1C294_9CYAN|nr:hypothetical protein [Dulcicalothrix desertica]RUS93984.1 hypothetical protein DSM106972_094550 [Dulcicalothrix desertica PCC 7102]TWH62668.1 hypothetical protein CAL7102_00173 [Dulcicalothrix desertica PCC 7102]
MIENIIYLLKIIFYGALIVMYHIFLGLMIGYFLGLFINGGIYIIVNLLKLEFDLKLIEFFPSIVGIIFALIGLILGITETIKNRFYF